MKNLNDGSWEKGIMVKRAVFFLVLILGLNLVTWKFMDFRVSDMESDLGDRTERMATFVAKLLAKVHPDDFHDLVTNPEKRNSEKYRVIREILRDCKDTYGYRFVFTFYFPEGGRKLIYVVDSETDMSIFKKDPGIPVDVPNTQSFQRLKKNPWSPTHDYGVVSYQNGLNRSISGYSPIVVLEKGQKSLLGFVEVVADEGYIDKFLAPIVSRFLKVFLWSNVILCILILVHMVYIYNRMLRVKKDCSLAMDLIRNFDISDMGAYEEGYAKKLRMSLKRGEKNVHKS